MGEIKGVAMLEENDNVVSAEEKSEDELGLAEVKAEEIKIKLAEEMGIDPELESDLLDKLVKRDMAQREKLNKSIRQKITWRDKVRGTTKKTEESGGVKPTGDGKDELSFDEKFEARMAERDLKELNLSEEVEKKVRSIAKVENISIREAAKHPYIQTVMEAEAQEKKVLDGTPNRNNKGSHRSSIDASKPLDYTDFDLKSEDGRKAWDEAKKNRSEYMKNNQ